MTAEPALIRDDVGEIFIDVVLDAVAGERADNY